MPQSPRMSIIAFLSSLAAFVALTPPLHAANTCAEVQTDTLACGDGKPRRVGDLLVAASLSDGRVGLVRVDPNGTEADVFIHASWPGTSIGDVEPLPAEPKEQLVLAQASGEPNQIFRLDECGVPEAALFAELELYPQHAGFAIDPTSGDLIISGYLRQPEASAPAWAGRAHDYYGVSLKEGVAPREFSSYLDSFEYEGANTAQSGAMTFGAEGTLFQSGYGQESLTSIPAAELLEQFPRETLHREGFGLGLNELVHDGEYLWGTAAGSQGAVVRIQLSEPTTAADPPRYSREVWFTPDFSDTSNSIPNRTQGLAVDLDGNLWVSMPAGRLIKLDTSQPNTVLKTIDLHAALSNLGQVGSLSVYAVNPPPIVSACTAASCSVAQVGGTPHPQLLGLGWLGLGLFGVIRRHRRHRRNSAAAV